MTAHDTSEGAPSAAAARGLWVVIVVLVGLNLRPFLTGVGPLAVLIHAGVGLDYRGIAWLTLIPLLLFGFCAFLEPAVRRTLGARRALLSALVVLTAGSSLRLAASDGSLLILTAVLCGLGAAVIQSIFPGVIKRQFPKHMGIVTGLFSASLMVGGASGAQLTPLIEPYLGGWRQALAWWAVPALLTTLLAWRVLPGDTAGSGRRMPSAALLRRPRTWLLIFCFGMINCGYAALVAWLPAFYQTHGWSSARSGGLVAVMSIGQACAALLLPVLARRRRDLRVLFWIVMGLQATGFAGFALWADAAPYVWVTVIGIGLGGSFALMLIVALDHLPDPGRAGTLAAFMQGGGFLIAATAPWLVALLHDVSGTFTIGWLVLLGGAILVALLATRLAPAGYAAAMGDAGPGAGPDARPEAPGRRS